MARADLNVVALRLSGKQHPGQLKGEAKFPLSLETYNVECWLLDVCMWRQFEAACKTPYSCDDDPVSYPLPLRGPN